MHSELFILARNERLRRLVPLSTLPNSNPHEKLIFLFVHIQTKFAKLVSPEGTRAHASENEFILQESHSQLGCKGDETAVMAKVEYE